MASIFTYDPDPPRVSSPWLTPTDSPKPSTPIPRHREASSSTGSPVTGRLADYGVTRLEAEPQEGPTEYKLHLLLRPRRNCMPSFYRTPSFVCLLYHRYLTFLVLFNFISTIADMTQTPALQPVQL